VAQYTETVGWVPEDAEATMKREVGDEVGNMAGGTETALKVTRPLKGPRWSGGNPPVSGAGEHPPGGAESVIDTPSLHPMNPEMGEGPRFDSTER
jgi:hypothetical protein